MLLAGNMKQIFLSAVDIVIHNGICVHNTINPLPG